MKRDRNLWVYDPGDEPAPYLVEEARNTAMVSPCTKSKRGVVIYDIPLDLRHRALGMTLGTASPGVVVATGFNGLPGDVACDASAECWRDCGKICVHAEVRAIREMGTIGYPEDCGLIHVKVVAGQVVAGGGPSCWQCSREIVDVGLGGVWLYERRGMELLDNREQAEWRWYTAAEFHMQTLAHHDLKRPT